MKSKLSASKHFKIHFIATLFIVVVIVILKTITDGERFLSDVNFCVELGWIVLAYAIVVTILFIIKLIRHREKG